VRPNVFLLVTNDGFVLGHERSPSQAAKSHPSVISWITQFTGRNCGRCISPLRRRTTSSCVRTRWPWVIAHPGLPQTRTCGHYRIRFLKSWFRCMTKLGTQRAGGSQRVTAEQSTEFRPVHRADVVAAIEPLTPSILDLLAESVHTSRVPRDSVIRVVSTQLLVELLLLFSKRQVPIVVAPLIDATHGSGETIRSGL